MKIAIVQSNYIPWKGYFDLINAVDEFVILDDAQYTKQDWRNRNRIKTAQGLHWLSVPVRRDGLLEKTIREVRVSDPTWGRKHWQTIRHNYRRTPHFDLVAGVLEALLLDPPSEMLSEINLTMIQTVNHLLGIKTPIRQSSEFDLLDGRTERLLGICEQCGATEYLSGPAARSYFDTELAARSGIAVTWMDYSGYPEYAQQFPPFEHGVSIIDLLFNEGPRAREFMKTFGRSGGAR